MFSFSFLFFFIHPCFRFEICTKETQISIGQDWSRTAHRLGIGSGPNPGQLIFLVRGRETCEHARKAIRNRFETIPKWPNTIRKYSQTIRKRCKHARDLKTNRFRFNKMVGLIRNLFKGCEVVRISSLHFSKPRDRMASIRWKRS